MAQEKRDYYEVLGISKGASEEEIKKAYKKLGKGYKQYFRISFCRIQKLLAELGGGAVRFFLQKAGSSGGDEGGGSCPPRPRGAGEVS